MALAVLRVRIKQNSLLSRLFLHLFLILLLMAHVVFLSISQLQQISVFEEIDAASSIVSAAVHPDCEIIWGANFDEELEE